MVPDLPRWLRCSPDIEPGHTVPGDFFGVNVATGAEPAADDRVIDLLAELGLRQVRCDLDLAGLDGPPARLLERLRAARHRIWLRLLQPVDATGDTPAWRDLLREVADRWPDVEDIEIGATVNRRRWSGYTHASYAAAWRAADDVLARPLAGPNVSDFEPLHAVWTLRRLRPRPAVQTVNLFVERCRIPEAYDHRVLGRWLAPRLRLNLVKKARIFAEISRSFGIPRTVCAHTCWNGIRLRRWTDAVEETRADYLRRYLLLAAASGALDRVYWGPLVGHADGLVDDGTGHVAPGERVARYLEAPGDPAHWTPRPAFAALRDLAGELAGATCVEARGGPEPRLCFERDGTRRAHKWRAPRAHSRIIAGP